METTKSKARENGTRPRFGEFLNLDGNDDLTKLLYGFQKMMQGDPSENFDTKTIEGETKTIVLPKGMNKKKAAQELMRQWENEEQEIAVKRVFDGWNYKDALCAVKIVSEQCFGWINSFHTFFSTPTEMDIVTDIINGVPQTMKCFYGNFKIAAWENCAASVSVNSSGEVVVNVGAKKKYSDQVSEYFAEIEKHLLQHSIYKGKTVVVKQSETNNGIDFEISENKGNPNIILNDKEEGVVQRMIIEGLSDGKKRTALFTGGYGTGKTETAMRIGREANKRGQTFFYCKEAELFNTFLTKAKRYQPAVMFLEDIDEIGSGERDSQMNAILNTLDGVETKGNSLTIIFTTNNPDEIHESLRRPGRLDQVVEFGNPNRKSIERIYHALLNDISGYQEKVDMNTIAEATEKLDVQGAVIAEICNRCRLMTRNEDLTTEIVLTAIDSMSFQVAFMRKGQQTKKPEFDWSVMGNLSNINAQNMEKIMKNINEALNGIKAIKKAVV